MNLGTLLFDTSIPNQVVSYSGRQTHAQSTHQTLPVIAETTALRTRRKVPTSVNISLNSVINTKSGGCTSCR